MIKNIFNSFKRNWLLFIFFTFFTTAIVAFEVITNSIRTEKTIAEVSDQLTTMTDLKAMQIKNWIDERLIDGQTIEKDVIFSNDIGLLVEDPTNNQTVNNCINRLRPLILDPNYSSVLLVDLSGKEILHINVFNDKPSINGFENNEYINKSKEIQLTNLYLAFDGTVKMDMIVPIFRAGNKYQPVLGYIVYVINPDAILYPLIQSLPTTHQTAETLLVRKENQEVVYLNELRFRSDTALKLRIPLSQNEVPAVMAATGKTGIVRGLDYRSVPVMASIVLINGTDWKLISKIDMEEINLPIRQQLFITILTALFLITLGILSINVLWRRQSANITRGLSVSENLRKNLQEKYSTLFNQANDAILLVEENGKIMEVNFQAIKMYGFTQEELLSLSISDLRDNSTKPSIPSDMDLVKNHSLNYFETVHKRKNGELFWVDVSSRYLSIDGKGFFQSLIRDITEKKQADEKLRLSELALKKAQAVSHVGSWHWDLLSSKVDLSDELYNIFNLTEQTDGVEANLILQKALYPEDYKRIKQLRIDAINADQKFSFETRILRPDGQEKIIRVETGEIINDENGNAIEISGIAQDITESKAAERELRKSENLLQRIFDILPVGMWITDEKGKLVRSNKMVKEIWGKDILVSIDDFNVFHGRRLPSREEIKPDDWASVHAIREGITIRDEMIEIDAYDGKTKTILNYSTPIFDDGGRMEGSIVLNLDISELKKAEEQLSSQLDELRRWNLATLGRENRIRELKMEINKLLIEMGQAPRYQSVTDEEHE